MERQNILITGATGFIGRNMVERFAPRSNIELWGTYFKTRPNYLENNPHHINYLRADLTKKDNIQHLLRGMDIVIQCADVTAGAGVSLSNPMSLITDKVIMNSLIIEEAIKQKVKHLIFFSCTNMYPNVRYPVDENDFDRDQIHPKYFGIGTTKVFLEDIYKFASSFGVKTTAIRHSNIYGPHDKYDLERSHMFGATVAKVMTATNGGEIEVWGDGKEKRDLLYVSDLVDFVETIIKDQTEPHELLNIGYGSSITIHDLVNRIINASSKDLSIKYNTSKPTTDFSLTLDCSKANQRYGYLPKVTLDEGIAKTLTWYKENIYG